METNVQPFLLMVPRGVSTDEYAKTLAPEGCRVILGGWTHNLNVTAPPKPGMELIGHIRVRSGDPFFPVWICRSEA